MEKLVNTSNMRFKECNMPKLKKRTLKREYSKERKKKSQER